MPVPEQRKNPGFGVRIQLCHLNKSLKCISLSLFTCKIPTCDSGMRMLAWLSETLWRSIEIIFGLVLGKQKALSLEASSDYDLYDP